MARPHIAPLPPHHPSPPEPPTKLASDETRPAVEKVRETLRIGISIQATGEATNAVVTGMVQALLDHIDELEADLNCAVAVGRMAGAALKPLLEEKRVISSEVTSWRPCGAADVCVCEIVGRTTCIHIPAMPAQTLGECICQEQHRRGYCTEPGCPRSGVLLSE